MRIREATMSVGIPVRDLRAFLDAAKAAVENPALAERLLQLCERNERVLESVRLEQSELACLRAEHERDLRQKSEEQAERLARERAEWAQEAAARRKRLEIDEDEIMRRRERAEQARQTAAAVAQRELTALQRQWQRDPDELMRKIHELVASRLDAAQVADQVEQRPTAA
jgi:hypothetical protein